MKDIFETRPIYLSVEEHIDAHFLICFVALLIFRILEYKLGNKFTTGQIHETLANLECSLLRENYYTLDFRNEVIEEAEKIFNIDFSWQLMKKSKIEKILQNPKINVSSQ